MKSYRSEIERLVPPLRQVARALVETHRADIADDLVHDALDEALRGERLWTTDELETKLYARLISANRLRLRAELGERRTIPGGTARSEATPSRQGSQAARGAGAGLDALPLGDREALLLTVLGRLDYARTAEVLGVPAGTLVARLSHARDSLGTMLWTGMPGEEKPASRPVRGPHLRLVKS